LSTDLTPDEDRLVEYAKEAIVKYNRIRHARGSIDTLYSFLLSDSSHIYDGGCFEPSLAHATICGERHAIANMVLQESYAAKIRSILVADPVPEVQDQSRPPCGTCRNLIWDHSTAETTVLLMQYIQRKDDWVFPKLEKHQARDLHPLPYRSQPWLWDSWHPK
jgi:cytidine deaminase